MLLLCWSWKLHIGTQSRMSRATLVMFLPYQWHTPHVPDVPEQSSPGKDIFFSHVLLHFSVASTPQAFHVYLAPSNHHPLHRKFAGISGLLELKAHFHWQSPALWSLSSERSSPCCFEQCEHWSMLTIDQLWHLTQFDQLTMWSVKRRLLCQRSGEMKH